MDPATEVEPAGQSTTVSPAGAGTPAGPVPAAPSNTAYEPTGTAMQLPTAVRSTQYEPDAQGVLEPWQESPRAIVTAGVQSPTTVGEAFA